MTKKVNEKINDKLEKFSFIGEIFGAFCSKSIFKTFTIFYFIFSLLFFGMIAMFLGFIKGVNKKC
jgi:hypothetical protein